ncbi:hypothetical protein RI103_21525 [Paraburkholderia sp. FT54]|uniref:hypothetical protein n=1 Tax=Paraburkholderia sp. FT54 TaxID=3074437 RepID=UPI0028779CB6|nr:hypothetical protein [Paraburkholderia sp. FT54]WNC93389.1 hypothetical protein RI103_21525 [Paraburkholderia sp. FT54]
MKQAQNVWRRVTSAFLAATTVVALTATVGSMASDQPATYVDSQKPGGTVKLYSAPDIHSVVMDAPTLPLLVQGASDHGFYPVKVNDKPYWVDGMAVKVVRDVQAARCSKSAGVQAAGTLGAATNRCQ